MIEDLTKEMTTLFRKGVFTEKTTFVFQFDDTKVTVTVDAENCSVEKGAVAKPDCHCKTSAEMFKKIWYQGYKPGIMDFMTGVIKADAPLLLPQFLRAFGKEPK